MKAHCIHPENKKVMRTEAKRQVFEVQQEFFTDFDALILWSLHKSFGFGRKRLKRFYDEFKKNYSELEEFYQMGSDTPYVAKEKLKRIKVNVDDWSLEK